MRISDVEIRSHWIARPRGHAPWSPSGRLPTTRTLQLEAERERVAVADCGQPCRWRDSLYQRRRRFIEEAMREVNSPPPRPVPPPVEVAVSPARRRDRRMERRSVRTPRSQSRAMRVRTSARSARDVPGYEGGVTLRVQFAQDSFRETSVDHGLIRRIAARMRADHGIDAEVRVCVTASEAAQFPRLARRRARRIKGLIAILGPSRRRFRVQGTVCEGQAPRVRIRLRQ